jgi:hypothetical protein
VVLEGHHLAHVCELDQGLALPTGVVAVDEVEAAGREDEEATIDQAAVTPGFLGKTVTWSPDRSMAP